MTKRKEGVELKSAEINSNRCDDVRPFDLGIFPGASARMVGMDASYHWTIDGPDYVVFIAEGCFYTHDKKRYIGRLLFFAVISHFAYDFAFGIPFFEMSAGVFNRTSVMWSLALAAIVVFCMPE